MSKHKSRRIGYRQVFMMLFTLFWVIYPYIARVLIKKVPDIEKEYFATSNGYIIDLLLFCKEVALAVFVGGCILYFIGERIFPDRPVKLEKQRFLKLRYPVIFIGGYLLFSVLSFLFSKYKETAFFGSNSEYEGLLAVICYVAVFLLACFYLKPETAGDKKISLTAIFKYGIIAVCVITGILGVIEIFAKPILQFTFIQDLISSEKNREIAHSIRNENFIGQICLTFQNPGFLGGFCALMIPVCLAIAEEGKRVRGIICSVAAGLMILAAKWSDSKVAMVSLVLTIPAFVIISIIGIKKKKLVIDVNGTGTDSIRNQKIRQVLVDVGIAVVTGVVMIVLSEVLPTYSSRYRENEAKIEEASVTAIGTGSETASTGTETSSKSKYKLTKAELVDGSLKLYSGDTLFQIFFDKMEFMNQVVKGVDADYSLCLSFSDGEKFIHETVPAVLSATTIRGEKQGFGFTDARYSAVKIALDTRLVYLDLGYSGTIEFYITDSGLKLFGQGNTLLDEIPQPRVTGLEKLYSFGTGRGYMWVQSLPLIWESILLGGGNGTYAFRFRQNEIVGLLNTHGSCKYVIDRPHNWYLQIALSDGVPALICVLALFVWYIIAFIKSFCVKKKENAAANSTYLVPDLFDVGMFLSLTGFMLCGMINDSCIAANPWFWLLLGCAVTRRVHNST